MAITIVPLRKGSRGIQGTYANAKHHAKGCVPLITMMESMIMAMGEKHDFVWSQGNNIHLLHRKDRITISLRPCVTKAGGCWGIDVLAKFSRSQELRLFTVVNIDDCFKFGYFLSDFLSCDENLYGTTNQNGRSNEFLASQNDSLNRPEDLGKVL